MKYNFCVLLSEKNKRVDIYLSALFPDFSRSYIQRMIDEKQVSVNGEFISKNLKIKQKDEIVIEIKTKSLDEVLAEDIKIDIIFEDENILILNKDAGINVHPVPWENGKSGTLVNAVLYHCKEKLPAINWVERPWIVHRLDKDTSWIILIAKTDSMMSYLSWIIANREIDKYYIAIVSWIVTNSNFKIESYIWRDPNDRQKMTTKNPVNPKLAITYFETIAYLENKYSILKVKLETGRTHQIRVHLASIGYPILWDKTYGNPKVNKEVATRFQLHRQALHARELHFKLYEKDVSFIAEFKDDMKKMLKNIF